MKRFRNSGWPSTRTSMACKVVGCGACTCYGRISANPHRRCRPGHDRPRYRPRNLDQLQVAAICTLQRVFVLTHETSSSRRSPRSGTPVPRVFDECAAHDIGTRNLDHVKPNILGNSDAAGAVAGRADAKSPHFGTKWAILRLLGLPVTPDRGRCARQLVEADTYGPSSLRVTLPPRSPSGPSNGPLWRKPTRSLLQHRRRLERLDTTSSTACTGRRPCRRRVGVDVGAPR